MLALIQQAFPQIPDEPKKGTEAGRAEAQAWLKRREPYAEDGWQVALLKYSAGELSDEQLLEQSITPDDQKTRQRRCEAYYYIGHQKLVSHDLAKAKQYFEQCIATEERGYTEFGSAQVQLSRMK